jgi:hypothetical protein
MKFAIAAAALACAFPLAPAFAVEPFKVVDKFSAGPIDQSLWLNVERTRAIKNGQLNLVERNYGPTAGDSGYAKSVWGNDFANPDAINEVRTKVTVNALEVDACAANASVGSSRARIDGSFFNVGTPVPGSQAGDVQVQLRVIRTSVSTDPAGVLRVEGRADQCNAFDCSLYTQLGTNVQLGTVNVGESVTLQLQWDQAGKQFVFTRDPGTATAASASIAYTVGDTATPGYPYKAISVRTDVLACMSGPLTQGFVDASFDNVAVNKSAAP